MNWIESGSLEIKNESAMKPYDSKWYRLWKPKFTTYQYLLAGSVDQEFVDIDGDLWAHALAIINQQGKKCLCPQWQ